MPLSVERRRIHLVSDLSAIKTGIPFIYEHHQVILDVGINGRNGNFLLDTGTSPSAIDLMFAKETGLKLGAEGEGEGAGTQKISVQETMIPSLSFGPTVNVREVAALAVDLSGLSKQLGRPLQGVLGHSFFSGRVVEIDYPKRLVRVFDHLDSFEEDDQLRTTLPIRFVQDSPLTEDVCVNGKRINATIDTGSSITLLLHSEGVRVLGLTETIQNWASRDAHGYGGKENVRRGTVDSLSLGNIILRNVETDARLGPERKAENGEPVIHGNVGNGLLERFVLTLDYVDNMVSLWRAGIIP
jgi:predicted aspartyl protease